jgi:hypothetical protein
LGGWLPQILYTDENVLDIEEDFSSKVPHDESKEK